MSWDEEFADRYDPEDTRNDLDTQPRQPLLALQVSGDDSLGGSRGLRSRERPSLGATLGAARTNNFDGIRTRVNSGD